VATHRVTVAPITFEDVFFRAPFEAPLELPYQERPNANLEVAPDETLKSALERAIEDLGVTVAQPPGVEFSPVDNLAFVAFYDLADENGFGDNRRFEHLGDLTTVDETGRALWNRSFEAVPYEVLVRTAEAGLLDGDPLRPYLILNSPEGNGVLLTWEGLVTAYLVLRGVLAMASDLEGALQFKTRLQERLRRAERVAEAVEQHRDGWASRGARPDNFKEMIDRGDPWSSQDLAERLGTPVVTAEAILEGFGFGREPSGLWRLRGDEDALFINDALDEAFLWVGGQGQPSPEYKNRIETYAKTNERPPFSWDETGHSVPLDETGHRVPFYRRLLRAIRR